MSKSNPPLLKLVQNSKGFTLIEVIIALTLMAVIFTVVLTTQSNSLESFYRARQMAVVSSLLQQKMVEVETEIQSKAFNDVKEEQSGTFKNPYEQYRWEVKIKEIDLENLSKMVSQATGSEGEDGGEANQNDQLQRMVQILSNYLSDSLREVSVKVTWPVKKGTQEYSITMLWVNLGNENIRLN